MRLTATILLALSIPASAQTPLSTLGVGAGRVSGGGPAPTVAYINNYSAAASGSDCTFNSVPIGTPSASRRVVVALLTTSPPITSMTIGGVAASQVVSDGGMSMWIAQVPSGSTGTITYDDGGAWCYMAAWETQNLTSSVAIDTANSQTNPFSDTLSTGNGVLIGFGDGGNVSSGISTVWTGITEDFDTESNDLGVWLSRTGASRTTTAGSQAITATYTNADFGAVTIAASFQ